MMQVSGHEYEFHPLDYDAAFSVASEVAAELLGPLEAVLSGPLAAFADGKLSVEDALNQSAGDMVSRINVATVREALAGALRAKRIRPGLIREALATTTRNGVLLQGQAFDDAFRGRLFESLSAFFYALQANGLFPWPSTSGEGQE